MSEDLAPILNATLDVLRNTLGASLLGVYLYGSAVEKGLRPQSDIDILAIIREPTTPTCRETLIRSFLSLSAYPPHNGKRPLEVTVVVHDDIAPWHHPPKNDLIYGEWLRSTFIQDIIPPPSEEADLTLVLAQARQNNRILFGSAAENLIPAILHHDIRRAIMDSLPTLLCSATEDTRNVLLTLARMWFTLQYGAFVSKDEAADKIAAYLPPGHAKILLKTRDAYLGNVNNQEICTQQAEHTIKYMTEEIRGFLN